MWQTWFEDASSQDNGFNPFLSSSHLLASEGVEDVVCCYNVMFIRDLQMWHDICVSHLIPTMQFYLFVTGKNSLLCMIIRHSFLVLNRIVFIMVPSLWWRALWILACWCVCLFMYLSVSQSICNYSSNFFKT